MLLEILSDFLTTWQKPDKLYPWISLESKGMEKEIPYKEAQTIWFYCNNKDQYLKKPDSVFKVMERESSVREQMEKQICATQMNSLLADSALKDSGFLIDAELAEGKGKNSILKQFLPAQINFAWMESGQGRCRAGALLT